MTEVGDTDSPFPPVPVQPPRVREMISPVLAGLDPEAVLSRMVEAFDLGRFYDSFPALFGREPESQDSFS